jgi:NTE family protein
MKCDGVFEGGGVKGIGLGGAVSEVEKAGYEFENLAGTSAGAIVASLLAAGYSSAELRNVIERLNYNDFKDQGILDQVPLLGKALSIGFEYGIYEGEFLEGWLENLLRVKGSMKFGDLRTKYKDEKYKYRLQVIASDISDHRLLVLPGDLADFGFDPDKLSISRAVRMSMSIPFFFEPVKITDNSGRVHYIVDGGVLSNYPIWLLDDGTGNPRWPTFGFKLMEPDKRELKEGFRNPINNPIRFLQAIIGTMMDAHDNYHVSQSKGDYDRTIGIPTVVKVEDAEVEIKTTDFDLSAEESAALYRNGQEAARVFMQKWNFEEWKKKYRQKMGGMTKNYSERHK